jgi:hypothetical protein
MQRPEWLPASIGRSGSDFFASQRNEAGIEPAVVASFLARPSLHPVFKFIDFIE